MLTFFFRLAGGLPWPRLAGDLRWAVGGPCFVEQGLRESG
jgi:hypothetical protein